MMKNFKSALLLLLVIVVTALSADFPANVIDAKGKITGSKIRSHIDFLSSEFCRGREAGDEGLDLAAKYITTLFQGEGLEAAGRFGSYYQPVDLVNVSLDDGNYLKLYHKNKEFSQTKVGDIKTDFRPILLSAEGSVTGPVIFAGYGITAPEHKYDDYAGLDAEGKIVLVMRHEPGEKDPKSKFDGLKNSQHGTLLTKIQNAQKHGAIGILFVNDPLNHEEQNASDVSGTSWASISKELNKDDKDFKWMSFEPRMRIADATFGVKIPAAAISGEMADFLLKGHSLRTLQQQIDDQLKPHSLLLKDTFASFGIYFEKKPVEVYNIVAKIEGSDPDLKDEYIILGAHYDHVGIDTRGRMYPGADDNASGTAGVIELARAFQNLSEKPKRSILILLLTAEEKGLLGSRYYVEHPIIPLEKTKAMINLDMIGRNDVNQFSLAGKYQYPGLFKVVDDINKSTFNFDINFSIEGYLRSSDHFPFMRKGIPSIFFNTGSHDQLHRPEDTVSRILPEKAEKITQLIFLTAWQLANMENLDNLGK